METMDILTPIVFGGICECSWLHYVGIFYFANFNKHKFILSILFLTFIVVLHLSSDNNYIKQCVFLEHVTTLPEHKGDD